MRKSQHIFNRFVGIIQNVFLIFSLCLFGCLLSLFQRFVVFYSVTLKLSASRGIVGKNNMIDQIM